ncbi:hypothetical protein ACLOJK_024346 [Asimina triloba]
MVEAKLKDLGWPLNSIETRCGTLLNKEASILRLLLKTTGVNLKLTSDLVLRLPGSKSENLRTQNSGGVGIDLDQKREQTQSDRESQPI